MPRTISSDYSFINNSYSHQQQKLITSKRNRRISKKKHKNIIHPLKNQHKHKNNNCKTPKPRIIVYSPEYIIRINQLNTPLYHSDQHSPCFSESQIKLEESVQFKSYIDQHVLGKMQKLEREQRELVERMSSCQIRQEGEE